MLKIPLRSRVQTYKNNHFHMRAAKFLWESQRIFFKTCLHNSVCFLFKFVPLLVHIHGSKRYAYKYLQKLSTVVPVLNSGNWKQSSKAVWLLKIGCCKNDTCTTSMTLLYIAQQSVILSKYAAICARRQMVLQHTCMHNRSSVFKRARTSNSTHQALAHTEIRAGIHSHSWAYIHLSVAPLVMQKQQLSWTQFSALKEIGVKIETT